MGRPRKFAEPVKINLILEKETKASAIAVALERKISVSRLFEALLFKELAESLTTQATLAPNNKTPETSLTCGDNASGDNEPTDPIITDLETL